MTLTVVEKKLIEYFSKYFDKGFKIGIFTPGETEEFIDFINVDIPNHLIRGVSSMEEKIAKNLEDYVQNTVKFYQDGIEKKTTLKNIPLSEFNYQAFFMALYFWKNAISDSYQKVFLPILKTSNVSLIGMLPFFPLKDFYYPDFLYKLRDNLNENAELKEKLTNLEEWYSYLKEHPYIGLEEEIIDFSSIEENLLEDDLNLSERSALTFFKEFMESSEKQTACITDKGNIIFAFDEEDIEDFFYHKKDEKQLKEFLFHQSHKSVVEISLENIDVYALLMALMMKYPFKESPYYNIRGKNVLWFFKDTLSQFGMGHLRKAVNNRKEELEENMGIKEPDLEDFYLEFKKNPYYGMKIKKIN